MHKVRVHKKSSVEMLQHRAMTMDSFGITVDSVDMLTWYVKASDSIRMVVTNL
jgi:hypothetical protein